LYVNGKLIDEVQVFLIALSDEEIEQQCGTK